MTRRLRPAWPSRSSSQRISLSKAARRWKPQRRDGVRKRLACFTVDDKETVLLGRETIFRNGEKAGYLASGGWGYSPRPQHRLRLRRNPDGVDADYLASGKYELEVAGPLVRCRYHPRPLYDPEMSRKCRA